MEKIDAASAKPTFTELMRVWFKDVLDPAGGFLNRLGFKPNTITLVGLVGNIVGAVLIARGEIVWGGLLVVLMGPIDALDGTMARLRGKPTDFGAFIDSVSDRYSELVIYGGLIIHFTRVNSALGIFLTFAAAAGSVLVSYSKARAETLGFDAKIGILTRVERYLVLAPGLLFNIPLVALWIIAILANVTAVQRIWCVRKQARDNDTI